MTWALSSKTASAVDVPLSHVGNQNSHFWENDGQIINSLGWGPSLGLWADWATHPSEVARTLLGGGHRY